MGQSMYRNRKKAWIREDHFVTALRRRIARVNGVCVLVELLVHRGQRLEKLGNDLVRTLDDRLNRGAEDTCEVCRIRADIESAVGVHASELREEQGQRALREFFRKRPHRRRVRRGLTRDYQTIDERRPITHVNGHDLTMMPGIVKVQRPRGERRHLAYHPGSPHSRADRRAT